MEKYLQFFYELAEIPHGSGNTKYISDYIKQFARLRGLSCEQDEAGNVIVRKEAHPERAKAEPVILQGHIDMVAVKEPDCEKDLLTEGLSLYTDGDYLKAQGTSLGGDDGIGAAYMLALLDGDYRLPYLECIFTVDEEIGMLGATALSAASLTGRRMINLDQEEEGIFIAGCAGGVRAHITIPTEKEVYGGPIFEASVSGLKGGHSGIDIDKNRGNAISVLGKELCKLNEQFAINLIELCGGEADNAIPAEATARFMLTEQSDNPLFIEEILKHDGQELYFGTPTDVDEARISVKFFKDNEMIALTPAATTKVLDLLNELPYGVTAMSEANPTLVETSLNPGILRTEEDEITVDIAVRSSIGLAKKALTNELCKLSYRYGANVELSGDYPGWAYTEGSALREKMVEIYVNQFGKKPTVTAIHAGLECGIFADKLPGLDCVSIGPDICNIHTCKEALSLSSAQRMYDYLVEVLETI